MRDHGPGPLQAFDESFQVRQTLFDLGEPVIHFVEARNDESAHRPIPNQENRNNDSNNAGESRHDFLYRTGP